jgi:tetratricopeptide (TPR) repeat protein
MRGLLALGLLAALAAPPPVAAQTLLPLAPPMPDLARLVPFAEAPGEKPPLASAALPLPAPPADLPPFPLAALVVPPADKPTAALAQPGALPCVGAFFGVAQKALECGRARFAKAEYEDAAKALEQAARSGGERELVLEARYWLAETYYVLARVEQADRLFLQVVQTAPPGSELGLWSAFGSGFAALRVGQAQRARDTFAQLLAAPVPVSMEPWVRHGLGLASYALGRHDEAVAAWGALMQKGVPTALVRDAAFWYGEALGRVGELDRAATELTRFVRGGAHPLLDQGQLRLGWWSLQAGRGKESVDAFRAFLTPSTPAAAPRTGSERDWAEAGTALALLPTDLGAARQAARELERRRSPLVQPLFVRFARTLIEGGKAAEAQPILDEVLVANLSPAARAYALLLKGEAARGQGSLDDARTQYDLAQRAEPGGATSWFAAFRLAQANVELREFAQAAKDLAAVVAAAASPDTRAAALLLQGEAAYYAGDPAAAGAAFRRVLVELPQHRDVPAARLGVAWSALRQDRADDARREFLEFVQLYPEHPYAPDALLLASELALRNPAEWPAARTLLDRIVAEHATRPRTDFARLNRALLLLRTGAADMARPELADWLKRAPFPPLVGRVHVAMGAALLTLGKPADAGTAFALAQKEGVGAVVTLGLGVVQLAQGQWEPARGLLAEARDTGTPAIAAAAEYGLGVVAFQKGAHADWKPAARAELATAPQGPAAPRLLYVLAGVAVEEKDWTAALDYARRLVAEFPRDEAADDALERVGAAAASAGAWPVAYDAYSELEGRYPKSPFAEPARLTLAEAQVETGHADAARQGLEKLVAAAPADAKMTRAWLALARAREATGDRAGALDAYARAAKDGRGDWSPRALLGNARLLVQEKRWSDARALLGDALKAADDATVAEAAYGLGEAWQGEGADLAAAEYFMTAAYVAPESPAGRRALLGAAQSFLALRQPDAAAIVYKKLLDQPGVPADLADAARKGLKDLGR